MRMIKFQNATPQVGIDMDKITCYAIEKIVKEDEKQTVVLLVDDGRILLTFPTIQDAELAVRYLDINTRVVGVKVPDAKKVLDHPNKSFRETYDNSFIKKRDSYINP